MIPPVVLDFLLECNHKMLRPQHFFARPLPCHALLELSQHETIAAECTAGVRRQRVVCSHPST